MGFLLFFLGLLSSFSSPIGLLTGEAFVMRHENDVPRICKVKHERFRCAARVRGLHCQNRIDAPRA